MVVGHTRCLTLPGFVGQLWPLILRPCYTPHGFSNESTNKAGCGCVYCYASTNTYANDHPSLSADSFDNRNSHSV